MTRSTLFLAAILLAFVPATASAQRPYKDGNVVDVTAVRTKPGMFDTYMKHLAGPYKVQMEAYKKAGLVVDWKVLSVSPRGPHDANVYLVVTYPNMAVFDQSERFDEIGMAASKSTSAQADKEYADRGSMREILGSTLTREVLLK